MFNKTSMDFISFSFLSFHFSCCHFILLFVISFCFLSFHFILYNIFSFCLKSFHISFLYAISFHFVCSHLTLEFHCQMLLNVMSFVCSHFISLVASRHFSKSMFRWKCLKIRIWWFSFKGQKWRRKIIIFAKENKYLTKWKKPSIKAKIRP